MALRSSQNLAVIVKLKQPSQIIATQNVRNILNMTEFYNFVNQGNH